MQASELLESLGVHSSLDEFCAEHLCGEALCGGCGKRLTDVPHGFAFVDPSLNQSLGNRRYACSESCLGSIAATRRNGILSPSGAPQAQ